jgi:aspartate ammonia-lyase
MTLGQEFKVWGNMIEESVQDLDYIIKNKLNKLNMGATAIGTGITADPRYSSLFILHLREFTGITELKIASNLVQATQDTSDFVSYSSGMKNLAIKLSKISNDLRLLSSGPRAGFNEINLPAVQPGSSIMPGKVNPVIPEVVNQVAFQVIGNDLTVNLASEAGQLELNAFEPVMAFDLFQSQDILINAMNTLASRAVAGITVNREICKKYVHESISLVTALNPYIGYENSTKAAKIAMKTGKAVYDIILEEKMMSKDQLDELMKPDNLIRPIKKLF